VQALLDLFKKKNFIQNFCLGLSWTK